MAFARPLISAICLALFFAVVAPRFSALQVAAQAAAQPANSQPAPEPAQAYSLPPGKLAKAIALSRIRDILDITGSIWALIFLWLLLATRAAAFLECRVIHLSRHRWVQGLLFFAVGIVFVTLAGLPFDMVGHHYSVAFGISVQGWGSWAWDQAKGLGLGLLIGTPVLLLFNWIVRRWPRRYWLGAWLVTLPLLVLSTFVSPLLEPIFNQFEPLAKNNAALVADLEKVVARTGTNIPPDRMFLMKASVKTNGLNAYVTGIGSTKRIVVWDTTAGRIPNDQVMFIFGHESGHYVLNHIPKGIAVSAIFLFFLYWACAHFATWMARRFGSRWLRRSDEAVTAPFSTRAGFVILLFAVSVGAFIATPLGNAFSRHIEHEADVYGQEAIHGLVPDPQKTAVASFNALGEAWLDDPDPNPFIEFWEYNHPSTKNRANFALHYNPWANGGHGRFFAQ